MIDTALEPKGFAYIIGRRERQNGRGEDRCVEQAESKKQRGKLSGQRCECDRYVAGILYDDWMNSVKIMDEDRRCRRNDNEVGDQIGPERTSDDVDARVSIVRFADSLFNDRGLNIELHPWRDGCTDDRDDHEEIRRRPLEVWNDRLSNNV